MCVNKINEQNQSERGMYVHTLHASVSSSFMCLPIYDSEFIVFILCLCFMYVKLLYIGVFVGLFFEWFSLCRCFILFHVSMYVYMY